MHVTYFVYQRWVSIYGTGELPKGPILDNLSHEQQFFVSAGQSFCDMETWREYKDDTHSPAPVRIFGMLSGFKPFANAFKCPSESRYRDDKACHIYSDDIIPNRQHDVFNAKL